MQWSSCAAELVLAGSPQHGEGQSSPHALSKATAVTTGCFTPFLPRGKNHVPGGGFFLVGSPPPSSSNWKQPQPNPTPAAVVVTHRGPGSLAVCPQTLLCCC